MTSYVAVISCLQSVKLIAEGNNQIRAKSDEIDVTFVDIEANFTFRNGAVESAVFQTDGLHLSGSGVDRLLSKLFLPGQTLKSKNLQHQHRHEDTQKATTHDIYLGVRASPGNDWKVVERRNRQRHTSRAKNAAKLTASLTPANTPKSTLSQMRGTRT